MFLHLGGDCMVKLEEVIMVINAENTAKSHNIVDFFNNKKDKKIEIYKIDGENVKSVIITDKKIYYSPISSQTLKKRAGFVEQLMV